MTNAEAAAYYAALPPEAKAEVQVVRDAYGSLWPLEISDQPIDEEDGTVVEVEYAVGVPSVFID